MHCAILCPRSCNGRLNMTPILVVSETMWPTNYTAKQRRGSTLAGGQNGRAQERGPGDRRRTAQRSGGQIGRQKGHSERRSGHLGASPFKLVDLVDLVELPAGSYWKWPFTVRFAV